MKADDVRVDARYLLGALVAGAAATLALLTSDGRDGTVVAKTGPETDGYACRAGGTVAGPVAWPVWGSCSNAQCWRLVVRDDDGHTSRPCVSREEYDRTPLGAFWHHRTDG